MTEIDLQLAEMVTPDEITDYPDWLAERKHDGVRAYTKDGRLYTRRGNDITARLPEIDPPEHHVLDGELVAIDGNEIAPFETTLRRVQTEDRFKVDLLADRYPARLVVFDALFINDGDVRDKPLTERQALIGPSIPETSGIVETTVHSDGLNLWDQATDRGWEGIMLKDPDAPYRGKRSDDWLKVKDWKQDTFRILDYEHTDDGGFVIYVDIGTDDPQKVAVQQPGDRREIEAGADVATVQFLERSPNNRLRKPSFKGFPATTTEGAEA